MGQGDEDRVARDSFSDASSEFSVELSVELDPEPRRAAASGPNPEGAIAPTGRRRSASPPTRPWARPVGRNHTRRAGTRRDPVAAVAAPTRGVDAASDILHARAEVASTARR